MDNSKKNTKPVEVVEQTEERAVLVAVIRDSQDPRQATEFLDELEFLAETASIVTVRRFTQRLPQPSSRIYVGPGKLEEIATYCADNEINVVIFDDELSPSQTRNIEAVMPCRVIDRTRLILDTPYPRHLPSACADCVCKDASRTCAVRVYAAAPCRSVDPP